MIHTVLQFIASVVQFVVTYWQILAVTAAAVAIWKLYKAWKRQYESQQMPGSGNPEYCTCSLPYGHWGKHLG